MSGRVVPLSLLCVIALGSSAPSVWAQRTQLKAPWNMYSPQTDVQLGKKNADLMEQRLPLCNNPKVDAYLTKLGMRLVAKLPARNIPGNFTA